MPKYKGKNHIDYILNYENKIMLLFIKLKKKEERVEEDEEKFRFFEKCTKQ